MLPLYLAFEGNVESFRRDIPFLESVLGANDLQAAHQYAYGLGEVPLLTRSTAFLRRLVDDAFDLAEREGVPLMLHLDPEYGFFADTEKDPRDAPARKYWNEPRMREWLEFPAGGTLPARIPRPWFNWGSWVSPAPALPAFGSPEFLSFARAQLRDGVALPIARRLRRLRRAHREALFAGINVGWETHFLDNRGVDAGRPPEAVWPVEARGVRMRPWEVGGSTGYASLHWRGWDAARLAAEARRRGSTPGATFDALRFGIVHDYMGALARTCVRAGLSRARIYTHIVAIASAHPEAIGGAVPPTWVAVNPDSVPGFTMDPRGAAVYDLPTLQAQIRAADPKQGGFAAIESYLANERDERSFADSLRETFDHGGAIKVLFGPFGEGTPFALDPEPRGATLAILRWLGRRAPSSAGASPAPPGRP